MKRRILMIEDDADLAGITCDMLQSYGYDTRIAPGCEQAFSILTKERFDLLLLDINLPDGTGYELCRELRKVSKVPVIFASARTSEDDKVKGLDTGGDDYLEKPYSLRELLARIQALIRRTYQEKDGQVYKLGKITVDTAARTVMRDGQEIRLALKEFDLLAYLCTHPNRAISKEELLSGVWGAFCEAEISTVAVHIRWLREKLEEEPANPKLIKTVWGVGYQCDRDEK